MAVITHDVWEQDDAYEGGVRIDTIPDPLAYGLAVLIDTTADLATTDWTQLRGGTLVVDLQARTLHVVNDAGSLIAL